MASYMPMADDYEVLELQFRPDLLEPAAHLLNEQWPRSLEARKHSVADSKTDLPVSLLLITKDKERVIGFVRIFKVANRSNAGLIESLVISPDMRRCGFGRRLMEAAEAHVKRLGYTTMHLSTNDQHIFYKRIGYIESTPVNAVRKCTAIHQTSDDEDDSSCNEAIDEPLPEPSPNVNDTTDTPIATSLPPPPPPPPPPLLVPKIDDTTVTKWYIKHL